jgi:hypothetical protein
MDSSVQSCSAFFVWRFVFNVFFSRRRAFVVDLETHGWASQPWHENHRSFTFNFSAAFSGKNC